MRGQWSWVGSEVAAGVQLLCENVRSDGAQGSAGWVGGLL